MASHAAFTDLMQLCSYNCKNQKYDQFLANWSAIVDRESPPVEYEALIRLVHEHHLAMSRTNKLIAEFITQYPNEMAVGSVNSLAKKCGVHASSLVRFAQFFGFSGFRDLQELFQQRLVTAAPGFEAR
ncbi:MAG: hypothetical protein OEM91_16475, partial [Hyphomicrobiales bacterium]|nr:hypothetical protein [Hyphomicrobiales bacterium]